MEKRAYRNTQDKVIAGVCTGLGEYFSIDPLFIRIIFLLFLFEPPIAFVAYIALWIALPKKPYQLPDMSNSESNEDSSKTFEERVEEIGKEAERIGEEFGRIGEDLGKKVEVAAEDLQDRIKSSFNNKQVNIDFTIESKPRKGKSMGIILIALGCIFLAHNYLPDFEIDRFWPVILIAIGISILFSNKKDDQS